MKRLINLEKKERVRLWQRAVTMSLIFTFSAWGLVPVNAVTVQELDQTIKGQEISFYREFFEKVLYKPVSQFLRLDWIIDKATMRKHSALDVNIYDEVPDSGFFTNRHGKKRLSKEELQRGANQGSGPKPEGPWAVLKGKASGVTPGLVIQDLAGDRYLLKFDPQENPEMTTSSEIISQKFLHAIGYHVAEYYLVQFLPDILKVNPQTTYYNKDGFKKPLTKEALTDLLSDVPKYKGGKVRASASKMLPKPNKGNSDLEGRNKKDPDDLIPHENRRSLRALRVFGSWLNHYDLREGNTLDVIAEENGKAYIKHYLIDFGSTLGSSAYRSKVPAATHENVVDWFETGKAMGEFKIVQKPWEKRWDKNDRLIADNSIGYFDNLYFNPGRWKTQLPHEVFERLTVSDAFWAVKIMIAFSNEDIQAMVDTAEYSKPETAKLLTDILIARRDLIAKDWFDRMTPLDDIQLSIGQKVTGEVQFTDLAVKAGFVKAEETSYRYRLTSGSCHAKKGIMYQEFKSPSFSFQMPDPGKKNCSVLEIQVKRVGQSKWSCPPAKILLSSPSGEAKNIISDIDHGL
ncbi:MAG: hypothetical protein A3G33_09465 [Omnitrophica bacterium RIFCSPLOWO2_12_FULL_44_17]|uniref:Uncharacterized protein n=1 Tax=Candidatus Danuiimicrobium aquiferis TaxID=1801832 RepID=A0A1G1KXS6_9BACT|nr:MAG: hypothetical protein A3B72_09895 [Omnitrophica bacterium RIFCSPHIGHO2_02_FULL_45_28]OGW91045.1 MAG: hypothetical protein A3E74_00340 [Omnitrophica bacterium RIFCSPHIGHO2_12_FULL_44_12]OGW97409.1 MAG: hypothetical protein A3G33_09465 [Omnitrophica bacterium RIFCSPLOWO2_12_FULL_44_17]OGX04483.1 MAG: hypothetical protein A3J12_10505 [Omnitrophica bacterium RIFCSPLOWO2_02_FULL_44_11]